MVSALADFESLAQSLNGVKGFRGVESRGLGYRSRGGGTNSCPELQFTEAGIVWRISCLGSTRHLLRIPTYLNSCWSKTPA